MQLTCITNRVSKVHIKFVNILILNLIQVYEKPNVDNFTTWVLVAKSIKKLFHIRTPLLLGFTFERYLALVNVTYQQKTSKIRPIYLTMY